MTRRINTRPATKWKLRKPGRFQKKKNSKYYDSTAQFSKNNGQQRRNAWAGLQDLGQFQEKIRHARRDGGYFGQSRESAENGEEKGRAPGGRRPHSECLPPSRRLLHPF